MSVLRELKRIRREIGMTPVELAERTNQTPFYIMLVEDGLDVSAGTAHNIARVLDVPLVDLWGKEPEVTEQKVTLEMVYQELEAIVKRLDTIEGLLDLEERIDALE